MYEMKSKVRYSEVDGSANLSMGSLMDYIQDSCTMQATDAGVGVAYLVPRHLGWIVTNYQLRFVGPLPKDGDAISILTTATKFRGVIGYRDYMVTDEDGTPLVVATSQWILLDTITIKPVRIPEEMFPAYPLGEPFADDWNLRHKYDEEGLEQVGTFTVNSLVIDTNFHMNNADYVQLGANCVGDLTGLKELFVTYKKSAKEGDVLELFMSRKGSIVTVVMKDASGEVYCELEFDF